MDELICPRCQQAQPGDARFCGHCRYSLAGVQTGATAGSPLQRRWQRRIGVAALTALLLVLLAVVVFRATRPDVALSSATLPPTGPPAEPGGATPRPPSSTPRPTATVGPTETGTASPIPTWTPTRTASPSRAATPTPAPTATATRPDLGPERITVGRSVNNHPIEAVRFGAGLRNVVFVGGLHAGFAPGTVVLAQRAVNHFEQNPSAVPPAVTLYIVLSASPDSPYRPGQLAGRLNAHLVDLNRNWDCRWERDARWRDQVVPGSGGPAPWSEPETVALRDFLVGRQPVAVVFWEAMYRGGLASAGRCQSRSALSEGLAVLYGRAAGYAIDDFEATTGQELNGDAPNWLAEQGIAAMSALLPSYTSTDWEANLAGILAVLEAYGR